MASEPPLHTACPGPLQPITRPVGSLRSPDLPSIWQIKGYPLTRQEHLGRCSRRWNWLLTA